MSRAPVFDPRPRIECAWNRPWRLGACEEDGAPLRFAAAFSVEGVRFLAAAPYVVAVAVRFRLGFDDPIERLREMAGAAMGSRQSGGAADASLGCRLPIADCRTPSLDAFEMTAP